MFTVSCTLRQLYVVVFCVYENMKNVKFTLGAAVPNTFMYWKLDCVWNRLKVLFVHEMLVKVRFAFETVALKKTDNEVFATIAAKAVMLVNVTELQLLDGHGVAFVAVMLP